MTATAEAPVTSSEPDSAEPLRVEVIMGSVRQGRFGPVVTDWFVSKCAQRADLRVGVVDLAEGTADLAERIGRADAVVVVTPEYNHSYPGPLKTAIDGVGVEWRGKPVAFVSYGGLSGGLRAVEALRVVFAELHTVTVRDTVSFHLAHQRFTADGDAVDEAGTGAAATVLLDQLTWWARALRAARARAPYGG